MILLTKAWALKGLEILRNKETVNSTESLHCYLILTFQKHFVCKGSLLLNPPTLFICLFLDTAYLILGA